MLEAVVWLIAARSPGRSAIHMMPCLSYHLQGAPDNSRQQVAVAQRLVLLWELNKISKGVVGHHLVQQAGRRA